MNCPFCRKALTEVVNSRATKSNTQIWRRRRCINCEEVFTTHELVDLSHIVVIKKSGNKQAYNRSKLYSGIFYASQASKIKNREIFVDGATSLVESRLLYLKKKEISSEEIADLVLSILKQKHIAVFLRFLTYCKDIKSEAQLDKELARF